MVQRAQQCYGAVRFRELMFADGHAMSSRPVQVNGIATQQLNAAVFIDYGISLPICRGAPPLVE